MKEFKFLVGTLLIAILPVLFTSCEPKPGPGDNSSIVGQWLVDEIKETYDNGNGMDIDTKNQKWNFSKDGKLTVEINGGSNEYTYEYKDGKLYTNYAETYYHSDHFVVNTLKNDQMILTTSYEEQDKVGKRVITTQITLSRETK